MEGQFFGLTSFAYSIAVIEKRPWLNDVVICMMLERPSHVNEFLFSSYAKKPVEKKVEPVSCEIVLHTALSSKESTSESWTNSNSLLIP